MFDELKWWVLRLAVSPAVWMLVLLILALGTIGRMDFEDAIQSEKRYCNMVKLHKNTHGDAGWPDYKATYDAVCLDGDAG